MTMPEPSGPTSWRDVYQLVRDTHEDAMAAIEKVDSKVNALGTVVDIVVADRRDEKVARQTESDLAAKRNRRLLTVIAASRGTIALIISGVACVMVILK